MPQLARPAGRLRVAGAKANDDNGSGVSYLELPALARTTSPKEVFDRLNPSEADRSNPCVRRTGGPAAHGGGPPFLSKAEALRQSLPSANTQCDRSGGQSRAGQIEGCVKAGKQGKKRKKSSNDALVWPEVAVRSNGLSSAEAQASREADNGIANKDSKRCKRRKEPEADSKKSKSNIDRRGRGEGQGEEVSHPSNQSCKPLAFDTTWGPFLCDEEGIQRGLMSKATDDLLDRQLEVTVSREASVVDAWLDRLMEEEEQGNDGRVLGLDIEWTPCYMKGQYNPAALLQLSSATRCLIVQLLHMDRRSQKLVTMFAPSSHFRFAGVGVRDDLRRLTADHFMPPCEEKAVELGTLAAKVLDKPDVRGWGLKALGREVLSYEMQKPKKVCMSIWGSRILTMEQVRYASLDAWLSYLIWKALDSLPSVSGKRMY
eukprot:TRINITY_DN3177_c0_g1_i1.p1 TRINITY_DN3177_c0_g1~~TRINITY_DN3177_c0_g1_i1.p1  ORF type:complete len:430 (-),score=82.46 TRINITY_DN3177_c0_g1_i1:50-1339(-)